MLMSHSYKEAFITFMVRSGVLTFGDFTTKSGRRTPYFINTGMFDGVKSWFFPILDPEKAAKRALRAVEKNKRFQGMPFSFRFTRFMQGFLPMCGADWIFGEIFGIYHAMDHFVGRKK